MKRIVDLTNSIPEKYLCGDVYCEVGVSTKNGTIWRPMVLTQSEIDGFINGTILYGLIEQSIESILARLGNPSKYTVYFNDKDYGYGVRHPVGEKTRVYKVSL